MTLRRFGQAENDMKEAQLKLIRSMNDAAERAQHSAVQSVSSSVDSSTRLLEPFLTENERTDNAQLATLQTMQAMQEAFDKQISRPDSLVARVMQQRAADLQRAARVATATAAPATGPDADVVSALQQLERAHAAADRVSADVERLTSAADPKPAATVTANNNNAR